MEVKPAAAPGRPLRVILDFLMLAGVSVVAGLLTAAVAAALVILLSGQADAGPAASEAASTAPQDAPRR